jgi:hypothetical protein
VDSGGNPGWKDIVKAQEEGRLAAEFVTQWFTSPRAVYELYDLESDPHELTNVYGQKGMEEVTLALKTALQKKMILDFDYLPLPIAGDPKKKGLEGKGDPKRAAMFRELDADQDRKLSQEEFGANRNPAQAEAWFKARDRDDNGWLSEVEYTASSVPNPPKF